MKDEQDSLAVPQEVPADADRSFLLECRLDQLHSALLSARAEADRCRTRLAEAAAREADLARRNSVIHDELVSAREEIVALHRRLEHSEALRAEVEGRLLESGWHDEAAELARLRREVREEREKSEASARATAELRARIEELIVTRETLLTRVAEWQSLVRHGDEDAVDLSEFIAALRGDILELEHRNTLASQREAELRAQLDRAGVSTAKPLPEEHLAAASHVADAADADESTRDEVSAGTEAVAAANGAAHSDAADVATDIAATTIAEITADESDDLTNALAAAGGPERQIELLLRLGRTRDDRRGEGAFTAIRRWATAPEPRVRAAAFEALGRLLEDDPARLEPHLRWGLADPDPRVRRRVVLAAATARGLALRQLLEPLRIDPDPQVRRVIHEVLRRTTIEPTVASAVLTGSARS